MGPKRSETSLRGNKQSQNLTGTSNTTGVGTIQEQEIQQCVGKFAADLELCCRESTPTYPINIPVHIRGHAPPPSQPNQFPPAPPSIQQQGVIPPSATHSQTPATPSIAGVAHVEDHSSPVAKKGSRARIPSAGQSGIFPGMAGVDYDNRSFSFNGQELSKISVPSYKTFHLVRDSEFFRPKLLVESVNPDSESIDQITALFMRGWQLDQQLVEIFKKVFPLQEQLTTLNLCYVGLNEKSFVGVSELCQLTKNLKNVVLDGNSMAADQFYLLIDKDDSKITHLSLRYCEINDEHIEKLASALGNVNKQNWKLLNLNLSGNSIGDHGAKAMANALRYNRTLISLNLSSNLITDEGAFPLAMVLRRIILTPEEIVQRRYLLAKRYAELHPEDARNNLTSPTPSNFSSKSRSGRDSAGVQWKRVTDPNKRKPNLPKTGQVSIDKRSRAESDENRPSSGSKNDSKRGRSEANTSRRTPTNNAPIASTKEPEQSRTTGATRTKKLASTITAAAKKNIAMVKEENEDRKEEIRPIDVSSAGKNSSLQISGNERDNPLMEINELESQNGQIWLKGNYNLLNLNLSRNLLTMKSVKEFLLTLQQQSALTNFNELLTSASTTAALIDFSGLCRLELKGMNDIVVKSPDYQTLENLLIQKNPTIRFQQYREREAKEFLDSQSNPTGLPPLQALMSDKGSSAVDKTRAGSSVKSSNPRPTSRLKE